MSYINKNSRYYVRRILGRVLKNNPLFLNLYNKFFYFFNRRVFFREISYRHKLPVTEYRRLASNLPFVPVETTKDSNYYGYSHVIKRYSNIPELSWSIEHGLMFGDYVPYSYACKTIHRILTFSESRVQILRRIINKPALAIGPYIHYASPLLDNQSYDNIKKQLGKTLLFFPSHSCVEGDAKNNISHEIEILSRIKEREGFESVLVCMYYLDIQKFDYNTIYEQSGFKVVTAGHQLDLNFLRRLKSIIMLSDYTVSSSVGTQVGYCVYLKKPHYIIGENTVPNMPDDYKSIYDAFSIYSPEITEKQYSVAAKYWGFNEIMPPEGLREKIK